MKKSSSFNLANLLFTVALCADYIESIRFDKVSSLHVWITVSSLVNKDTNNAKSLLFRQIELNWINAPLEDENDYIGLYLDSQPDDNVLPVSVHRLNNQINGQIITDYYLPQIDFYNQTSSYSTEKESSRRQPEVAEQQLGLPLSSKIDGHNFGLGQGYNNHNAFGRLRHFNDDYPTALSRTGNTITSSHNHNQDHSRRIASSVILPDDECVGYCLAYHSRNKILARNCLRTNPNWMRGSFQHISSRSLPWLMIPGTHNSGTYSRHLDKTALQMINKYQMNQDENIFNQLVFGIRHLDLRVGYSKVKQRDERLWIYHDIFRTEVSLNEVFEQVRRFLDMTSHEIVIMDFHRFTVGFQNENISVQKERHSMLIDMLFKNLGEYVVPSYLGLHAPLNEYLQIGKRLNVGYADRSHLLDSSHQQLQLHPGSKRSSSLILSGSQQRERDLVRDIDAIRPEDYDEQQQQQQSDRNYGSKLLDKLKSLKLISKSFSKRSADFRSHGMATSNSGYSTVDRMDPSSTDDKDWPMMRAQASTSGQLLQSINSENFVPAGDIGGSLARVALFFAPVRHLWPNKDTVEGLSNYMNATTCKSYYGELRSMMVELTPTVFGAISDKYDGNRRLAQLVNRQVSDWIRDRWLHCINIVASDFFLGNNLISLAIQANKVRMTNSDIVNLDSQPQCAAFRKVEHLLDKSKIPIQFVHHQPKSELDQGPPTNFLSPSLSPVSTKRSGYFSSARGEGVILHTSPDGNQIFLRPLTSSSQQGHQNSLARDRRDSFVENVTDSLSDLIGSFRRLFNF